MRLLLFVAFAAASLRADVIPADGAWIEFVFGQAGTFATKATTAIPTVNPVAIQNVAPAWTFSGPGVLQVIDLFLPMDQFAVYDNNVLLGTTSSPVTNENTCGADIGCALHTPAYSFGEFNLGAGVHSITIGVVTSPMGSGAAAFSATAVPEPGVILLLALQIMAAALVLNWRRTWRFDVARLRPPGRGLAK